MKVVGFLALGSILSVGSGRLFDGRRGFGKTKILTSGGNHAVAASRPVAHGHAHHHLDLLRHDHILDLKDHHHHNHHDTPRIEKESCFGGDCIDGVVRTETKCFRVPYSIEKTCHKEVKLQSPYACPGAADWEECVEDVEEVEDTCFEEVDKAVEYQCPVPKAQRICHQIPVTRRDVCSTQVSERYPKPCERQTAQEVCKVIAHDEPDQRFEVESYEETYDCWTTVSAKECDAQTYVTKGVCEREISTRVPTEYLDTEEERVCEMVADTVVGNCKREKTIHEEYPCPEVDYEEKCIPTERVIPTTCNPMEPAVETYDCSTREKRPIRKKCSRTVPKQAEIERCVPAELVGCEDRGRRLRDHHLDRKCDNACVGSMVEYNEIETYDCEELVDVVVPKICTRAVASERNKQCVHKVEDKFCYLQPVRREKMCKRPRVIMETYDCDAQATREQCRTVPQQVRKKGFKLEKRVETYECDKTEIKENCVEVQKPKLDKCTATLLREVEVPCSREVFEETCAVETKLISDTCYEDRMIEKRYDCFTQETEEKCITATTYDMDTCKTIVKEVRQIPCTKQRPVKRCGNTRVPVEHTCFKESTVMEPYKCFEVAYNDECVEIGIMEPLEDCPVCPEPPCC